MAVKMAKNLNWLINECRSKDVIINLFDVGARNGILHLSELAEIVDAFGFEPNPVEFQKLINGATDLKTSGGIESPSYRRIQYFELALCDQIGTTDFYVTAGPTAGLSPPNMERLNAIRNKGGSSEFKNYAADVFTTEKVISVETSTLDEFVKNKRVDSVDYLKIDVEGAEFEVLKGASGLLPEMGVLFIEVCFFPFRKNQKLFSDIDVFLRQFGFELVNYQIVQSQIGYKQLANPTHPVPAVFADLRGQPLSADAVYINTSLPSKDRLLAQAAVMASMGYTDEALYILKEKLGYPSADLEFLRQPSFGLGRGELLRFQGYKLIDKLIDVLGKIA